MQKLLLKQRRAQLMKLSTCRIASFYFGFVVVFVLVQECRMLCIIELIIRSSLLCCGFCGAQRRYRQVPVPCTVRYRTFQN